MKKALKITLVLMVMACAPAVFADSISQLDGKKINLTARCSFSKMPDQVYAIIGKKKYLVKLPEEFQNKVPVGPNAWIGLTGVCRDKKIGSPGFIRHADGSIEVTQGTAEYADGFIEVTKVLFFDQKEGRKFSVHVLK